MKAKLLLLVLTVMLVAGLIGSATMALFTDTAATTSDNFTAGTIVLDVRSGPQVVPINISGIAPGYNTVAPIGPYYVWVVRNIGTLPGRLSVTFSQIINNENVIVEPESAAEGQPYANAAGELGQYLVTGIHPDEIHPNALPYVTFIERNDAAGWYIAEVSREVDTRGTIGWGPAGWTVPSRLFGHWPAGPPNPWGTPGLNHFGGRTFGTLGHLTGDILQPGGTVAFFLRAALHRDLQRWDGTGWRAVDDNIIQSDSAHFDISFNLVSVH